MVTGIFHLNIKKIKEYAHNTLNCQGEITGIDIDSLNGGFSQAQVFRITLTFEDCPHQLALVQKVTDPGEVQVMLALSELVDFEIMPEVIDHAWSQKLAEESDNWFITPFYAGTALTFQDEVPAGVVRSLTRLHHYFQGQTERFESLYRVDTFFFEKYTGQRSKSA